MPQGFTGDVRQTVLESTSQRETRAPDSLLVVVSNGIKGERFRATVHPSVQGGAQTQEGGEAAPLHPFSWAQGLHLTAWSYWRSYWPVPFRHVLSHMGRCSLQHGRVTESRAGDSSIALPGRWPWEPQLVAFLGMVRTAFDEVRLLLLPQTYLSDALWQGEERSWRTPGQLVGAVAFFTACLPLWAVITRETSILIWSNEAWQTNEASLPPLCLLWKDKGGTGNIQTDGMKADPGRQHSLCQLTLGADNLKHLI